MLENKPDIQRILHMLPDLAAGGGQQVLLRSLQGLKDSYKHYICFFEPNRQMEPLFIAAGTFPRYLPHGRIWTWPSVLICLIHFIRKEHIDLIHIQGTPTDKRYGQIAAWWCRVPVVRTLHGVMHRPRTFWEVLLHPHPRQVVQSVKSRLHQALDRILDRWTVSYVIAVSEEVKESWSAYLNSTGIEAQRIMVSYNGVPVEEFRPPGDENNLRNLRKQLDVYDCYPVLINVGRISAAKGQDLLVSMLPSIISKFPGTRLLLVGDGDYRDTVEEMARAMNLDQHVVFLGFRRDVPDLFRISDIFVFSSLFEGFPLVVLEALAAGTPVVSVALPGLDRVVKNGFSGRIVAGRDPERFGQAVIQIARDRETLKKMGEAGRQLITKHYDISRSVQDLKSVYEGVLRSDHCKRACSS